jgi:hypothetical protein
VVEYPTSGFKWVMLRVELSTHTYQWAPMMSRCELNRAEIKPRWSPPHSEEAWNAEFEATVVPYRR